MQNFKKYQQLTISGQHYATPGLQTLISDKLAQKKLPDWEITLYSFLREWLNDEDFVTIHTSGSTGTPKPIRAGKDAMLQSAFQTLEFFKLGEGQSALLCLPCNYIAGKMMVVRALAGGLNLIPVPVTGHPLETINAPVDFAAMTPLQMSNELNAQPSGLQWLRKVILGGAPVSRELQQKLNNYNFKAWETYGMTETLSHIALKPLNGAEATRWFTPLPGVILSADHRGCLTIEAKGVTPGPVITNDLVELRADGRFRIKGRIDHVINSGGVKICPEEVEQQIARLLPHPFAIVPAKHHTLGQQPVLITEQPVANPKELIAQMKNLLPPYHAPRKIVVINPLPRTQSGKIKRTLLP